MDIQERMIGTVAVLTLRGRMMSKPDVAPFGLHLQRLMGNGISRVVVDLSGARWLSAAMLSELVDGLKATHRVGGDLRLAEVTPGTTRVLEATQLNKVFWVGETVDQAVAKFVAQDVVGMRKAQQLVKRVQVVTRPAKLRPHRREALRVAV